MKKLLFSALLLLAAPAFAASYTLNTTAGQEAIVTRARTEANAAACAQVGLSAGCTQAQADAKQPGGATIYANNGAYLLSVLTDAMVTIWNAQKDADKATFEERKATATAAQKNALCAAVGLPAGCLP